MAAARARSDWGERSVRLLILEDNEGLAEWLAKLLRAENYVVDCVADGETAVDGLDLVLYDLALVDLGLPGMSGIEVIKQFRARGHSIPILILTARGDLKSRVDGLNSGADDYLTKPFEVEELEARMRALLRRSQAPLRSEIVVGPLVWDQRVRTFALSGEQLHLSPREAAVLEALVRRGGQAVSKERLLDTTYGFDDDVNPSAIEVIVHRLRKRLEGSSLSIVTLRGLGYLLRDQP